MQSAHTAQVSIALQMVLMFEGVEFGSGQPRLMFIKASDPHRRYCARCFPLSTAAPAQA